MFPRAHDAASRAADRVALDVASYFHHIGFSFMFFVQNYILQ